MADESRGRTVEKRNRPSHQTQTERGEGNENLNEHNVEVQDFAALDSSSSNTSDTRNLSDYRLAAMRKGAMTSKKNAEDEVERGGNSNGASFGQSPHGESGDRGHALIARDAGSRSELSASKNQPRWSIEKEWHAYGEAGRGEDEGFGKGSHGPILRKPMLGERGHGPVVRGGRGSGRGRGGPGVSVMED